MNSNKLTFNSNIFPNALRTIPGPPRELYVRGDLAALLRRPRLTVVGSRKVTAYGRAITTDLITGVARAGVVIISGLAIGVDSIAHCAALASGGQTIAVLPSGLDAVYPACHRQLARRIVETGGALVSEYPPRTVPYPANFIARNRLASGLGQAVFITEAAEKSGTLHTARFALEQGKDVLVAPGNITSAMSVGTNNLLKAGATPVTCVSDILYVLGVTEPGRESLDKPVGDTPQQQTILDLLAAGTDDGHDLLIQSGLDVPAYNQALTMLEITGTVRPLGADKWAIVASR